MKDWLPHPWGPKYDPSFEIIRELKEMMLFSGLNKNASPGAH